MAPLDLDTIEKRIDDFYASKPNKPRSHMGISTIGEPCDRKLWLKFRWAVSENFPGRMLRLFERGHREEAVIVEWLRSIGMEVKHVVDDQKWVNFGSHVSGSADGIIYGCVPEAPEKAHLLEMKTASEKSFKAMCKDGLEKANPTYYTQVQCYMLGLGLDRALFVMVNKNDDGIYTERVRLDKKFAQDAVARAQRIATSDRMPPPISTDPTWYQCSFCPAKSFCHESRRTTEVNCRTCLHSTATPEGKWTCARWGSEIPIDAQYAGCDSHALHPDMVPWTLVEEKSTEWTACYRDASGAEIMNGEEGVPSKLLVTAMTFEAVFNGV